MAFTIICIHPIVGCKYLKILKEDEYYFFNDWYREENGCVVRNVSIQPLFWRFEQ